MAGAGAWKRPKGAYKEGMVINPADEVRVRYAVQNFTRALRHIGYTLNTTGEFDASVSNAVAKFQDDRGLTPDRSFGPFTAEELYRPFCDEFELQYSIPNHWLCGQVGYESAWDPGAENINDDKYVSVDRGLVMSNDVHQPEITDELAYGRSRYMLVRSAANLRAKYDAYKEQQPTLPDDILWGYAVQSHNWPVAANSGIKYVGGVRTQAFSGG
jgi:peptidoglycan hydrolase-like protein with peptidoglycan-binding domain